MDKKELHKKLKATIQRYVGVAQQKGVHINVELLNPIKIMQEEGIGKGGEKLYEALVVADYIKEIKCGNGVQTHYTLQLAKLLETDADSIAKQVLDLVNIQEIRRYKKATIPKSAALEHKVVVRKVPPFLEPLYYMSQSGIKRDYATSLHIDRANDSVRIIYEFGDDKNILFVGTSVEDLLSAIRNSAH